MNHRTAEKVISEIMQSLKRTALILVIELWGIAAFIGLLCIECNTTGIGVEVNDLEVLKNLKWTAIAFTVALYGIKAVCNFEKIIGKSISLILSSILLICIPYSVDMISAVTIITAILVVFEPVIKVIFTYI